MKKDLVIFDFDATLMNTPEQAEGMLVWKEKTGNEYPHIGWWSRPESLDMSVFDINPNLDVLEDYFKHKESDDMICLVTGRIKKLEPIVKSILDRYDLTFNGGVYCKTGGKDTLDFKLNLFKSMIENNDYRSITIYEDRFEHVKSFDQWIKTLDIPGKVVFV
jgi:hypothetical protein